MATQKQYQYTLPIGYKLQGGENDYVIEEVLGKGGFGVTYKVKATIFVKKIPIEAKFAIKEYFPDICSREVDNATIKIPETKHDEIVDGIKDFINEGRKLQDMCDLNPNIVNVNEVFEANGTAYYVLEYLEGGDLRKMVKNNGGALTEQQMLDVMIPIGRAVQCLHDNNILHLDIKPDNIVMRRKNNGKEEPVLIDFGIAVHFRNDGTPTSKTPSQGISPGYSPVEQYSPLKKFDPRIDVYAYAATCLFLLTGKDPNEVFDLNATILSNEIPKDANPHIAHAIIHAMSRDKELRTASVSQVLYEMKGVQITSVSHGPGTRVTPKENLKQQQPTLVNNGKSQKSSLNKTVIGIAIALVIAIIAGIVFYMNSNSKKINHNSTESTNVENDTINQADKEQPSDVEQSSEVEQNSSLTENNDNKIHFSFQEIPFSLKINEFCERLKRIGYTLIEDSQYDHYKRFKDDEGYSEIWVHWIEQTGQVYMVEDVRLKCLVTEEDDLEKWMYMLMDDFGREPVPINESQEGYVFDYGYIAFGVDDNDHVVLQFVDNENYNVYRNLK